MKIPNILKAFFLVSSWLFSIGCGFVLGPGNSYYNSTYTRIDITTSECFDPSITADMTCSDANDPINGKTFWVYVTEVTVNDDNPDDHTLYDGSEVQIVTDKNGEPNWDEQLYDVSVDKQTGVFILEYNDNETCSCLLKNYYTNRSFGGVIPCTCTVDDMTCYLCYD